MTGAGWSGLARTLPIRLAAAMAVASLVLVIGGSGPATSQSLGCGGSSSDPGAAASAGGFGLESGVTAMNRRYVVRAIGALDPSVSAELDAAIARIDQVTDAALVRGPDEAMPPGENPGIFPMIPGEIDVFTNTWSTGPYASMYGNWTYEVPAGGRVSGAVISITMGTTGGLARPTVWHELGHAVGLDHYFSPYLGVCQMMSYGQGNLTDYQLGDRNGLQTLAHDGGFGPAPSLPVAPAAPPSRPVGPRATATAPASHPSGGSPAPAPPPTSVTTTLPTPTAAAPVHRPADQASPLPEPTPVDSTSSAPRPLVPAESAIGVLAIGYLMVHHQHAGEGTQHVVLNHLHHLHHLHHVPWDQLHQLLHLPFHPF